MGQSSIVGKAVEAFTDLRSGPLVSLDGVSKRYAPLRTRRIERISARLGGIVPDTVMVDEDEDEDLDDLAEPEPVRQPNPVIALHEVTLTAAGGSCVAVVGPPGAGKSVLLKIVAGIVPPSEGRAVVRGTVGPALDWTIGLLPKGLPLARSLPILAAMLRLPPRLVRKRLGEIFELIEAPDLRSAYPSALNGKQRQAILLAMMLCLDSDVVLVDGWMPKGPPGTMQRIAEKKAEGSLVIVAARDAEGLAGIADRAVHLERGRVVADERM